MSDKPKITQVSVPTEGVYKNNPVLTLPNPDFYKDVTLGASKCRIILKHLDAIRAFVAKHPVSATKKITMTQAQLDELIAASKKAA